MQIYPACQLLEQGQLRAIGRYQACTSGGIDFAWSGSGIEVRFVGTGLQLRHRGPRLRYARVVDGKELPDVYVDEGEQRFVVASQLPPGEHVARVLRQGEALFGSASWLEVEVVDGQVLTAPPAPARRLEIYGDSISCGYGNEGADVHCTFSAETQNHYQSYGALLARALGADLSTVAWSGKGVAQNFARQPGPTLVDLAELALPEQTASVWTSTVAPQAVLINLGTNDFSTEPDPTLEKFVEEYGRLLGHLRGRYPQAFLLCTVGPMLSGVDLARAEHAIATAVEAQKRRGDERIAQHRMTTGNTAPGCDWHPSLATHQRIAQELYEPLRHAVDSPAPSRNMK
jgi:lysophospholipase L1-like esterase